MIVACVVQQKWGDANAFERLTGWQLFQEFYLSLSVVVSNRRHSYAYGCNRRAAIPRPQVFLREGVIQCFN